MKIKLSANGGYAPASRGMIHVVHGNPKMVSEQITHFSEIDPRYGTGWFEEKEYVANDGDVFIIRPTNGAGVRTFPSKYIDLGYSCTSDDPKYDTIFGYFIFIVGNKPHKVAEADAAAFAAKIGLRATVKYQALLNYNPIGLYENGQEAWLALCEADRHAIGKMILKTYTFEGTYKKPLMHAAAKASTKGF